MNKVKVKICGIKNKHTVTVLAELAVDYIGFLFARSTRKISEAEAATYIEQLHQQAKTTGLPRPNTVGVFVNPSIEQLDAVLAQCALDVIQLHGDETPEFCQQVKERYGVQLFKVFSVRDEADDASIINSFTPYSRVIDTLMLDTHDPLYGGGSGVPFRWSVIPKVAMWCQQHAVPLMVAGGLNERNVGLLLEKYALDGVDVSSGVETAGEKDEQKMRQFVGRVKS